jgi:hypothetical protein
MRWFRNNITLGARLALIALATNLALSFGHFHDKRGVGHTPILSLIKAILSPHRGSVPHRHHHHQKAPDNDECPICMAATALGNAPIAAPPSLPLQVVAIAIEREAEPVRILIARPAAAFQSRGPPIS